MYCSLLQFQYPVSSLRYSSYCLFIVPVRDIQLKIKNMCLQRYVSGTSFRKVSSGHKSYILFPRPWAPTHLHDHDIPWDSFFSPDKFEDSFINWPRRYISVCPCCRHAFYGTCTYYNCLPEDKDLGSNRVLVEDIVNVEIICSFKRCILLV